MIAGTELIPQFAKTFQILGGVEAMPVTSDTTFLNPLYSRLPGRFPRLYEQLVLAYRWPEVDLRRLRLLPNPEGKDLSGLLEEIFHDRGLAQVLIPAGLVQFGKAAGICYDPVCFDTRRQRHGGDCPVVQLDHEEALLRSRIQVVTELAPSFHELMLRIIEDATEGNKPVV